MPCENSVRMVIVCKNDVKKADNLKTYYFKIICFLKFKNFADVGQYAIIEYQLPDIPDRQQPVSEHRPKRPYQALQQRFRSYD